MGLGAVILVRLPYHPGDDELTAWRNAMLKRFDPDAFCIGPDYDTHPGEKPPLHEMHKLDFPTSEGVTWLDTGIMHNYYGKGYERGDLLLFIELAKWLEKTIPDSQIWYGESCSGAVNLFDAKAQEDLLAYYREVGHRPYDERAAQNRSQFKGWKDWGPPVT